MVSHRKVIMRFVLFLFIFITVLSAAGYVAYLTPYHIYTLALKDGLKTDFIETKVLKKDMLQGGSYKLPLIKNITFKENIKLWPVFHFSHFKIPFPVHHPLYNLIPLINYKKKQKTRLGLSITNRKDVVMSSILVLDVKKISLNLGKYKLFNLPFFKKYILDTDLNKLWQDLFLKDLTLPDYDKLGLFKYISELKEYSYQELVYNLFILKMRTELFPPNSLKIGMLNEDELGIVELINEDKKYTKELIYLRENNNIRLLELVTRKFTNAGNDYRNRVLKEIRFLDSREEASVHLYSYFRELTYAQKTDQEGMIYLYSAWSHSSHKKEFLVQMIQWLERGQDNQKQLSPLYNFATNFYGTSFSSKDQAMEDARSRLEKKIKEELEQEIRDAQDTVYKVTDGKFESEEKQIEYFLQKARDDNVNSDEDEDILVVE
jgi:hypothetical protein